jgi:hypothetical protein
MTSTPEITKRKQHLAKAMDFRGMQPCADYDYEHLLEVLEEDEAACARFAAVRHDETYSFIELFETAEAACAHLAASLGEETGGSIEGVIDLDTGELYGAKAEVTVSLENWNG